MKPEHTRTTNTNAFRYDRHQPSAALPIQQERAKKQDPKKYQGIHKGSRWKMANDECKIPGAIFGSLAAFGHTWVRTCIGW